MAGVDGTELVWKKCACQDQVKPLHICISRCSCLGFHHALRTKLTVLRAVVGRKSSCRTQCGADRGVNGSCDRHSRKAALR